MSSFTGSGRCGQRVLHLAAGMLMPALAAAMAPTAALSQNNIKVSDYSKSGHWSIVSVRNGMKFSHCSAGARYKSGTRVGIVALANGQWRLSFYHQDWPERTGQKFNARLMVDGREVLSTTGQFNKKSALIDLGTSSERIKALMRGKVMSVQTPSGNSSFRLDGSNAATGEVARCWTSFARNTAQGGGGGGAFGAPSSGSPSAGAFGAPPAGAFGGTSGNSSANTKLSRSDTLEFATRYLGNSAVPFEILPAERNIMRHFPVNWRYRNGALGGMMALRGVAQSTDVMLGRLLAEQTGLCKGQNANQRDPAATREGRTLSRGASVCSAGSSIIRKAFTVWKSADNMMLIVMEAGEQKQDGAAGSGPAPAKPAGPRPNEI